MNSLFAFGDYDGWFELRLPQGERGAVPRYHRVEDLPEGTFSADGKTLYRLDSRLSVCAFTRCPTHSRHWG